MILSSVSLPVFTLNLDATTPSICDDNNVRSCTKKNDNSDGAFAKNDAANKILAISKLLRFLIPSILVKVAHGGDWKVTDDDDGDGIT